MQIPQLLSNKLSLLHNATRREAGKVGGPDTKSLVWIYVWGWFFFCFVLFCFNPIHTLWHLRGSGNWEKCKRMMHISHGSRSENKKRMTRYTEGHQGDKGPWLYQVISGRQHLSRLISYLPQNPLAAGHDYTKCSNNTCCLRLVRSIISLGQILGVPSSRL